VTAGLAVVADGAGGHSLAEVEIGVPGPGEVGVALAASGVCHTDLDAARTAPTAMVLGHEGAGTVTAVGEGVDRVRPGDRVLLTWSISCGTCFQCGLGNQVFCERLGLGRRGHAHPEATTMAGKPLARVFNLGTMSTATVVRQEAVVPLPEDIPFTSACILGCGVMTGYGSVVNAARVRPGSSVVVLGCGGVGLNVIQGARIAGAGRIIAIDVSQPRLDLALMLGAHHVLTAEPGDAGLAEPVDQVRRLVGRRGADYAFECTGVPDLAAAPLRFVRHGGTAVQVSGVEQDVTIDMRLFEFDKVYLNPLYGNCRPSIDFPILLDHYRSGRLMLDELVTATYTLEGVDAAFADMVSGANAKGVLVIG